MRKMSQSLRMLVRPNRLVFQPNFDTNVMEREGDFLSWRTLGSIIVKTIFDMAGYYSSNRKPKEEFTQQRLKP